MNRRNAGYIHDVDQLIEETPLELVLSHYGIPVPNEPTGEYRIKCPFNENCSDSPYGNLTIKQNDPAKVVFCHSCEVRGNLLTLIHGLESNRAPSGGRLRGQEFKAACMKLKQISQNSGPAVLPATTGKSEPSAECPLDLKSNIPLRKSENEQARKLANLYEDLLTDLEAMPPEVAAYFRRRPWLTLDVCNKWGIGYLPRSGRSMFRGWIVYTHRNQRGDVLTYSGRDPQFETKWNRWIRDGKPESKKPIKHKYVKGFMKGNELYGQQSMRLDEPVIAESLSRFGLFVVEGMNDVVRLDELGIASVGVCSNRATEKQMELICTFGKKVADGRIVLLPDCDEGGETGFKELLWGLCERGMNVRLGWTRNSVDVPGIQPENLDANTMQVVLDKLASDEC